MHTRQGDNHRYESEDDAGGKRVPAEKHQAGHDGSADKAKTESGAIPVHVLPPFRIRYPSTAQAKSQAQSDNF
ncbi:MAG: hypothetical protein A2912_00945 [Candidatus Buchananbacteria bacterium RIFCSPLOWO2_01_FULL_40_23b]|uniref:Uncharacterized protein n=1 Tax=Candidatus Buchananbacteria bacterium RIFCSPLOWO2_01_FULL_40_23b TaxID=1797544 RepID=A0A1G1YQH7_9BACT|nr:MAG: hypothetical protein A2912_00945 [Candidatus Buchananbacteria bacterium RIFCSPLOWO2_01_FULL_40_23b]